MWGQPSTNHNSPHRRVVAQVVPQVVAPELLFKIYVCPCNFINSYVQMYSQFEIKPLEIDAISSNIFLLSETIAYYKRKYSNSLPEFLFLLSTGPNLMITKYLKNIFSALYSVCFGTLLLFSFPIRSMCFLIRFFVKNLFTCLLKII